MKKLLIWMLSAALCASLTACGTKTPDAAPESAGNPDGEITTAPDNAPDEGEETPDEVTAAYQAKVAELEAERGETLSWVQFACGTGEKILVVTKESSIYADGATMDADVYQYADGETHYLTSVSSTGSAYPIAFTQEAVLFGGNHTAGKLVIHEGTAELYRLVNMNIEGRTPVLETYDVADGEQTLKSSEELSPDEENAFNYYTNAFADEQAEVIGFQ